MPRNRTTAQKITAARTAAGLTMLAWKRPMGRLAAETKGPGGPI
jgi:hypothetical protein